MLKLKLKGKLPDGTGVDGLTRHAGELARGETVFAIVALEALHLEVTPEGDELAVIAQIVAAEGLPNGTAEDLLARARDTRTGADPLPLVP